QTRIGLRLRPYRQLWRRDPRHPEQLPLADRDRLATDRERVRERRRPDVDIDAAVELADRIATAVAPAAAAVRLEVQRAHGTLGRDDERRVLNSPRFVPRQAVREPERALLVVECEHDAVRRPLAHDEMLETDARAARAPERYPGDRS